MPNRYVACDYVELPGDSLSPVKAIFELPDGISSPSEVQLRQCTIIRSQFSRLWNLAMDGLQQFFDENTESRKVPRESIREAAITIHEPSDDESDDNFFWNFVFVLKPDVLDQFWEVHFTGLRFQTVVIYP